MYFASVLTALIGVADLRHATRPGLGLAQRAPARRRLRGAVLAVERGPVAREERERRVRAEPARLGRVEAVLAVDELDDAAVGAAHRVVVPERQPLEVLDEAALQVTRA